MIVAEGLGKQFGDFWAVDGIDLHVQPGQVVALLGQNGAGKTTTVRLLTSLLKPTRGKASIAGYDISKQAQQVRSSVGVLSEQHGLYLRMSGEEYLDFFGAIYRLSSEMITKRSKYLLDYFGLANVAKKRIGEYSKGMRQKLALARALIHDPPVLLFDEPTSAMDPESALLVRASIHSLRSEKRAIVICTHNLLEAELLADQVAIIYRGRIYEYGPIDILKENILGPETFEIKTTREVSWDKFDLPGNIKLINAYKNNAFFSIADPKHENPILLRAIMSAGEDVITMRNVPRTLEDVYLKTMTRIQSNEKDLV